MQENYHTVVDQMEAFGIKFRKTDLPLKTDQAKRKTCGLGGKWWYRVYEFKPKNSNRTFVVGSFGSYKTGDWQKVDVNWEGLSDEQREQAAQQQADVEAAAEQQRKMIAHQAALSAVEVWRRGRPEGQSPYLEAKGLVGESCRYVLEDVWMIVDEDADVFEYSASGTPARPKERRVQLPVGTLLLPMIRYDLAREQALQAVQHVLPNGRKIFTKGFHKPGCALRLGEIGEDPWLIMMCEGYATGLSVRLAIDCRFPVFVAFDAGNLMPVAQLLADKYPDAHILVCADDDWTTRDQLTGKLNNPGKTKAKAVSRAVPNTSWIWPVFENVIRHPKDTDFDDLRRREGLDIARAQIGGVVKHLERRYGR
ncbi:Toprim domain-containing protein [Comamonas sp. BIGb0124]|uniref:toprim domain-containing protein n=1 Tax=Comamonas sp. BIGb0124 TaxID=2485130 RepID=UPI000F97FF25|nr:toprim domain-containing protein [Comamonas sp. BIGb0124]ROR25146.1 Toprim domain-containing protein [Comamonas sp. BIGb0124]